MHSGLAQRRAGVPADGATFGAPLVLGPIIVARAGPAALRAAEGGAFASRAAEFVVLCFPDDGLGATGREVMVTDAAALATGMEPQFCTALLAPRRFFAGLPSAGAGPGRLARSSGLRLLQRYLEGLLALDPDRLCERQKALSASAVRRLLVAALAPAQEAQGGLKARRRDALIGRVIAHIDAHLREELTVDALCAAAGCSRSVLYRAAEDAGGAAELVARRRLLAVHDLLRDGGDERPIAAIAEAYRFSDVTQFNRRFKAIFGATPGAVRRLQVRPDAAGLVAD